MKDFELCHRRRRFRRRRHRLPFGSPGALADIVLLEQESIPGFHASGRNAAMMRQCVPDPDLAKLTRDGAAFLRNLPADWPEPVQFKHNGSLLLGSGAGWEKLKQDGEIGRSVGVPASSSGRRNRAIRTGAGARRGRIRRRALVRQRRHRRHSCFAVGLSKVRRQPGRADSLQCRGAGASRASGRGCRSWIPPRTIVSAKTLVNASGAWANVIAELAGARRVAVARLPAPSSLCRRRSIGWIRAGRLFGTSRMISIFARRAKACCSAPAIRPN